MRLHSDDREKITEYLLLYRVWSIEYLFDRTAILHGSSSAIAANVGGMPAGGYSDPSSAKAIRLCKLDDKNRWLAVIRAVEERLLPAQITVLKARRLCWNASSRNGGWVDPTRRCIEECFPEHRHLSDLSSKTLQRIWKSILDAAIHAAQKERLM